MTLAQRCVFTLSVAAVLSSGATRCVWAVDATLQQQFAQHYRNGNWQDAAAVARQALAQAEQTGATADELLWLRGLAGLYCERGRYAEAIPFRTRLVAMYEAQDGPEHTNVADALLLLSEALLKGGQTHAAEPPLRRAIELRQKRFGQQSLPLASAMLDLGELLRVQARYKEAERVYREVLATREKLLPAGDAVIAQTEQSLGDILSDQGDYAAAEASLRRSLAAYQGPDEVTQTRRASVEGSLALLMFRQGRYGEAEAFSKRAIAHAEVHAKDSTVLARRLTVLANICLAQRRFDEAGPLYVRVVAIDEETLGPGNPTLAVSLQNLANYHQMVFNFEEAELTAQRALEVLEKVHGEQHPTVGRGVYGLAMLALNQARPADSEELCDRAIQILDRTGALPEVRFGAHVLRGQVRWQLGKRQEAVADSRAAVEIAETQRHSASGAEQQRAESFAFYALAYEQLFDRERQLGDIGGAFADAERSRARGLLDQMQAARVDLLAGVPPAEALTLRQRESQADAALADAQAALRLALAAADKSTLAEVETRVRTAQQAAIDAYVATRNASRAYRQTVDQDFRPLELAAAVQRLAADDQLVLEYVIGEREGYVIVIGPGDRPARIEMLEIDADQARTLGIYAGSLNAVQLQRALVGAAAVSAPAANPAPASPVPVSRAPTNRAPAQPTRPAPALAAKAAQARGLSIRPKAAAQAPVESGLMKLLREPRPLTALTDRLAVLWSVLIPQAERELLLAGKVKRLVVIPDGPLYLLPFEPLIVKRGANPRYLLDLDVPIVYAPSATLLANLQQSSTTRPAAIQSVLTVGDPLHGRAALAPLPSAARESAWVKESFQKAGLRADGLQRQAATEAAVRSRLSGRQILHFACHGLVDESSANLLGGLALVPGSAGNNPLDDGQLTLAEVYGLDLSGCELAILSACETNFGPQQRGEGVWALSRGFLVAGTRRVIASNWLVDDESAATLISYLCSELARTGADASPDYARALHKAKQLVRQTEKWQSPFYWAVIELIGPP